MFFSWYKNKKPRGFPTVLVAFDWMVAGEIGVNFVDADAVVTWILWQAASRSSTINYYLLEAGDWCRKLIQFKMRHTSMVTLHPNCCGLMTPN